jgi:hypothetical protein
MERTKEGKLPGCKAIIADQALDIMMLKELAQGNL